MTGRVVVRMTEAERRVVELALAYRADQLTAEITRLQTFGSIADPIIDRLRVEQRGVLHALAMVGDAA